MSIRDEVLDVLASSATRRISFSFASVRGQLVTVNATTFQRVADAINAGRITVSEERRPGRGGTYDGSYDREIDGQSGAMTARRTRGRRRERAYIVHESVHASFDLTFAWNLPEIENEAAGFLAQFLFLRHAGVSRSDAFTPGRANSEVFGTVWNATSTVVGGGTVPERHMTPVRNQIERMPFYRGHFRVGCTEGDRGCYFSVAQNG